MKFNFTYLFCRHIRNYLAIYLVNLGSTDISLQYAVHIYHWQLGSIGLVELGHHLVHRLILAQGGRRLNHQLTYLKVIIQFRAEDDMTEAGDINYTFQYPRIVQYRQEVVVASRNLAHQLAHRQIWTDGVVILLNHALHAHQRKRRTVYVVSEQLALPSQSQGVDAMALEDADGEQGRDAHDHQRHEELIAAREFGDEEDARQRSMQKVEDRPLHEPIDGVDATIGWRRGNRRLGRQRQTSRVLCK